MIAKKKFYGSLAGRIVLILFAFIIIPLIFYAGLMWYRDWHIKLNAVFEQLELVGKSNLASFEQWSKLNFSKLDQIFALTKEEKDLTKQFENPYIVEDLSTLFAFDASNTCLYSNQTEMIGTRDFFPEYLKDAFQKGTLIFVGHNRYTDKEEIFFLKRFKNQIWGLSIDASYWSELFVAYERAGYAFVLTFVDSKGSILFSSKPNEPYHEFTVLTLDELTDFWNKKFGFWKTQNLRGKDLAVRIPIPHATFEMQIEIPATEVAEYEGVEFLPHLFILSLLFLVIGGLGTWWLVKRMARPLNQLSGIMESISEKNYEVRYHSDPFGFEINALGNHFNRMLDALLHNMERANNEKIARELLAKELQIGLDLQMKLLPRELPYFSNISMGKRFVPAKEVSGDFYDLFVKDKGHLLLVIADGSDKGISACLYSLMVRSMLRSHALAEEGLSDIVRLTNNLFCRDTADTGNFVTAWIGLYEISTNQLLYTSAGHYPAVLIRPNGQIEELMTKGIALGAQEISDVQVKMEIFSPSSLLFLYTDGVIEAQNEKGEFFGKNRLFDFLQRSHTLEPQDLIDKLIDEIYLFAGKAPQSDDLTILSLKTFT